MSERSRFDEFDYSDWATRFASVGWNDIDIGDQAVDDYSEWFDITIEEFSPLQGFISGVATAAREECFRMVAYALNVDREGFELVMGRYLDRPDKPPPPISPENLVSEIEKETQRMNDLRANVGLPPLKSVKNDGR